MSKKGTQAAQVTEVDALAEFGPVIEVLAVPAAQAALARIVAVVESTDSKSAKIRALLASGMKRGDVAKTLGIRYQHVRNVELTPLKKA